MLPHSLHFYILQGLTQVEEMLLSAVMPIMSIYRLPHGLYGYSGHVINLPQDVHSFVLALSQLPSQLDIVLVKKEGASQCHRDFHVRRSVVVNGAMGTVEAICYHIGGPPDLPIAVMVQFDSYTVPTLHIGCVPITPIRRTWSASGVQCSRLQLPLKLSWAVTIHKSQGLTLDKVMIDVGKREFSSGLTFVALSSTQTTRSSVSPPFGFQMLSNLAIAKGCREDCWKTNDCCCCKYLIQLLPFHIFGAHYNLSVSPII